MNKPRGRPRIYKDNAEKLRVWRARRLIKDTQLSGRKLMMDIRTREKTEALYPELKEEDKEVDIDSMNEQQFQNYIREENPEGAVWTCLVCGCENFIYSETCVWCGLYRPDELDEEAKIFLTSYPMARKWTKVLEPERDKLFSRSKE